MTKVTRAKFIHDVRRNEVHEVLVWRPTSVLCAYPSEMSPQRAFDLSSEDYRHAGARFRLITYEEMVALRLTGATVFLKAPNTKGEYDDERQDL